MLPKELLAGVSAQGRRERLEEPARGGRDLVVAGLQLRGGVLGGLGVFALNRDEAGLALGGVVAQQHVKGRVVACVTGGTPTPRVLEPDRPNGSAAVPEVGAEQTNHAAGE